MKIAISASMFFHKEMSSAKTVLEKMGHTVYVPNELDNMSLNESYMDNDKLRITAKIEYDFIREHFKKVEAADAILILNHPKNNIEGYIGGNTFLEMGYAYGLAKKIFVLFPIPPMDYYTEMMAMQPIVLNGKLELINN